MTVNNGSRWILGVVLFAVMFMTIGNAMSAAADGPRSEILAATEEWVKHFSAGDAAAVAAMYTEDAKLIPPNSDFVAGRKAIQAVFQSDIDAGFGIKFGTDEVTAMGDSALQVGTYVVTDKSGKEVDHGKYMVVWKKTGSRWSLHRDMWNTSMPLTPAQ